LFATVLHKPPQSSACDGAWREETYVAFLRSSLGAITGEILADWSDDGDLSEIYRDIWPMPPQDYNVVVSFRVMNGGDKILT